MSVTPKAVVEAKYLEAAQTTQYTASGVRFIVDKATVTNVTASNAVISANLVPQSGTVGNDNLIIYGKTVVPGETYQCPELVGQVINPGGFLSTIADTASALVVRISGREIA